MVDTLKEPSHEISRFNFDQPENEYASTSQGENPLGGTIVEEHLKPEAEKQRLADQAERYCFYLFFQMIF